MKYFETIKSLLLFILVFMSLTFTVMIWNYKPNHEYIEATPTEEVSIGNSVDIKEILTSYRALLRVNNEYKGTESVTYMDDVFNYFSKVNATDITLVNNNLKTSQINELMRTNNRMMLFFEAQIPLHVFMEILNFENKDLPDMSFDRIILDWNDLHDKREVTMLLLNTDNGTLYRTSLPGQNESKFKETFVGPMNKFVSYMEYERKNSLSLYASTLPNEAVKYMYYIDESPVEQFKSVLFQNPNIVKKTVENATTERYMDSMSFMTVDTNNRILNYVYPASEGFSSILPSTLLKDSYDFINDHGGFNADYRLVNINSANHGVDYQLYFQGYPVFSSETITKIYTTWGDNQLHKYRRPYYVLEMDIPDEMAIKELPSGQEIIEQYTNQGKEINDVVLGYYLVQNTEKRVFELEPAWFIIRDNGWERIKLEQLGGMDYGLE